MAVSITHAYVSTKSDPADSSIIGKSKWNANHVLQADVEQMLEGLLPIWKSVILMWKGTRASIPAGWALCDGQNGTIDLRDKFIVGAVADYSGVPKSTVTGSPLASQAISTHQHTVPDHRHSTPALAHATDGATTTGATTLTVDQIPAHTHGYYRQSTLTDAASGTARPRPSSLDGPYISDETGGGQAHTHAQVAHKHGDHAANNTGYSGALTAASSSHVPPFYALCFIQWIGG